DQTLPLENIVDSSARSVSRAVALPSTTTTSTTTTSTTSTTERPALGPHYTFTSAAGSANCTIGPLSDPPTPLPPLSGQIDSDTEGTKIADLGLACLYIGGGAGFVAPSQLPENANTIFNSTDLQTLLASFGTSERDCTKGPTTTSHCVNNSAVACTSDDDCFRAGACRPEARCFVGPPVPGNGFRASCVVNTFAADASGMIDLVGSSATLNVQLASRVFISTLNPTACPQCIDNACTFGQNPGGFCQ